MTLKTISKHLFLVSVLCTPALPFQFKQSLCPAPPEVAAKAWVLMSYQSGQIIASENEQTQLAPASLTKIMTTYVVGKELEAGHITADDKVTISENAWGKKFPGSSKMFLNIGDEVSVNDLNRGGDYFVWK